MVKTNASTKATAIEATVSVRLVCSPFSSSGKYRYWGPASAQNVRRAQVYAFENVPPISVMTVQQPPQ